MLKFGVCDARRLFEGRRRSRRFRRFVSIDLYSTVARSNDARRDEILSEILAAFSTRSGTFKWTQNDRFGDFDDRAVDAIGRQFDERRAIDLLDLGVSDGRTAVELFRRIEAAGRSCRFIASDYAPDVLLLSERGRRLVVAVDPADLSPLQVVFPPFVFNVTRHENPLFFPLNRLLLSWLRATAIPRLLERARAGDTSVVRRTELLVHPTCLTLLEERRGFTFVRLDVRRPIDGAYDVIRAMNVLNESYFSAAVLAQVFAQLHRALRDDGLLIVGSNAARGTVVDGTIYAKHGSRFEPVLVSGKGSAVTHLVPTGEAPTPVA